MYIFINLKVSENKITIFISFYLTYFIYNVFFGKNKASQYGGFNIFLKRAIIIKISH